MRRLSSAVALTCLVLASMTYAAPVRFGSVILEASVDPLTDLDTSLVSTSEISDDTNTIFALWICQDDDLQFAIYSPNRFVKEEAISGIYRFDKLKASPEKDWSGSTNGKAAFMVVNDVKEFTSRAIRSNTLAVRLTTKDGNEYTFQFKIDGLKKALSNVSCAQDVNGLK